jgi:two-component system sensor histidine kinase PilS (NtrC family)
MHACGGVESGLGILLIINIIMTSLLCTHTLTLTFAALATVALLAESIYSQLGQLGHASGSNQVGLLGMGLLVTAFVSTRLTREIRESNELAKKQHADLANLSILNDHIIENMQSGVIALDQNFQIQHINNIAIELLLMPSHSLNIPLQKIHPALWELFDQWIDNSMQLNRLYLPAESYIDNVQIRFKRIENNKQQGYLIFLDDLSIIHKQANQTKLVALGHLTANIAHEIRNPLGAISHASQLLAESTHLDATDIRMTEIIGQHSERINHIIEDVLQISRSKKINRECIAIESWLQQFIHDFCLGSEATNECFAPLIQTKNSHILFDSGHLSQILTNICQNAKMHGIKDHPIHLITSKTKYQYTIEIADEGPGIGANELLKVLEPFYTTNSQGSGLGLYIVNQLCDLNSAKLQITSNQYLGTSVKIQCQLIDE